MSILEINNLQFEYRKEQNGSSFSLEIHDFFIQKGCFTSLLGPNGCGKSTLLKIISRILSVQKGRVKFSGIDISEIPYKEYAKLVAYVPQSTYSYLPFSVYEIVMMGRTPYLGVLGFESNMDRKIVDEALNIMEASHLKNKGINEISGGEAQRVFIARALAQNSEMILLDEPNAHLDIEHQIRIFDILAKLNKEQGITILSVSHDLNLVGIYSEDVIFMINGKLVLRGNKSDIFTEANIKKIFNVDVRVYNSLENSSSNVLINPIKNNS